MLHRLVALINGNNRHNRVSVRQFLSRTLEYVGLLLVPFPLGVGLAAYLNNVNTSLNQLTVFLRWLEMSVIVPYGDFFIASITSLHIPRYCGEGWQLVYCTLHSEGWLLLLLDLAPYLIFFLLLAAVLALITLRFRCRQWQISAVFLGVFVLVSMMGSSLAPMLGKHTPTIASCIDWDKTQQQQESASGNWWHIALGFGSDIGLNRAATEAFLRRQLGVDQVRFVSASNNKVDVHFADANASFSKICTAEFVFGEKRFLGSPTHVSER
jgi:hypothetical protein